MELKGSGEVHCVNGTNGTTVPMASEPLFGPNAFFIAVAGLIGLALAAFVTLLYWPYAAVSVPSFYFGSSSKLLGYCSQSFQRMRDDRLIADQPEGQAGPTKWTWGHIGLLLVNAWVCALMDSILPSVQTYAARPYGLPAYHYVVIATGLALN